MIVRFLIFAVLVLMIDVYFYQGVRSLVSKWSARRKKTTFVIYWGFTGFAIALMLIASFMSRGYANHGFQQYAFNVILIVTIAKFLGLVPLLINDLYRLVHLFIGLFHQKKEKTDDSTKLSRLQFFNRAAVGLAAIPMVALIYGMVKTAFDFTVRKETIKLPNLPAAFDGLKILQISDIHSGSFVSEEPFKKAIKLINEQKPDIIFFTGDLVNDRSLEAERFINVLSTIKAPMGVYSVLGNHDYGDYVDIDEWGGEEAKKPT
ncbi:MAG: metallophosphoesterase [Sphingobacteriales bacterium JAD_PAG50586_3]|nr:MAG: metallophosphoesterase [Sphingobacteriales bacterium JAD_PAG50586_3]